MHLPTRPAPHLPATDLAPSAASATSAAQLPAYTVSVRSLCEFTAKRGDLDRRFTPSATALEGMAGQAGVAVRRGSNYEREITLEGQHGLLRVRGRADGFDPQRKRLEEIKTIRGDPAAIPANRSRLHWAQVETYGALLCRARGLGEVELALVYVDAATQDETLLTRRATAAQLEAAFADRCDDFAAWAEQEAAHRSTRDIGLGALPFPPGEFRPGQRSLAEAVYRGSVAGRCVLAQAPTGLGKTIGTLYPMLRAMPGQRLDQIAYLTCKTTSRSVALRSLASLRDATPGRALRVLVMVARDEGCVHPDRPATATPARSRRASTTGSERPGPKRSTPAGSTPRRSAPSPCAITSAPITSATRCCAGATWWWATCTTASTRAGSGTRS